MDSVEADIRGRQQSLARIEINDWRGDGGIMPSSPPRGRFFTPPLQREDVRQLLLHKEIFSSHLTPPPPLSDGDSWPHGRWGRCSQSCEIATLPPPSLLFHPPTDLTPHSHRRSICPRRRLDTSLETGSRQPQPKYADCRLQYKGSSSNTVFLCGLESSFKCRFFPYPF